jgi:hypothetical protein
MIGEEGVGSFLIPGEDAAGEDCSGVESGGEVKVKGWLMIDPGLCGL